MQAASLAEQGVECLSLQPPCKLLAVTGSADPELAQCKACEAVLWFTFLCVSFSGLCLARRWELTLKLMRVMSVEESLCSRFEFLIRLFLNLNRDLRVGLGRMVQWAKRICCARRMT